MHLARNPAACVSNSRRGRQLRKIQENEDSSSETRYGERRPLGWVVVHFRKGWGCSDHNLRDIELQFDCLSKFRAIFWRG